jgi:hypothetical protein
MLSINKIAQLEQWKSWSLEIFLEKTMKFTLSERCSEHCWFFLVRSDMSLIRMISSLTLSWQNTCDHVVSNTRNKNDGETRISWVDEPKCPYGVTNQTGTGVALELDFSANMKDYLCYYLHVSLTELKTAFCSSVMIICVIYFFNKLLF